jgi:hypothetical protein
MRILEKYNMPCHAMHPIQDLFLKVFHMYYNLICNFYMHSYVDKNFHSCKKWVLHTVAPRCSLALDTLSGLKGNKLTTSRQCPLWLGTARAQLAPVERLCPAAMRCCGIKEVPAWAGHHRCTPTGRWCNTSPFSPTTKLSPRSIASFCSSGAATAWLYVIDRDHAQHVLHDEVSTGKELTRVRVVTSCDL